MRVFNTTMNTFCFRADANAHIGLGHFMRCLAIAQEIVLQGDCVKFLMREANEFVLSLLQTNQITHSLLPKFNTMYEEAEFIAQILQNSTPAVHRVILDGYEFDAEYQRLLKESNIPLVCVDDHSHAEHYYADYIINPQLTAQPAMYDQKSNKPILMLGHQYILLRQEIRERTKALTPTGNIPQHVLVTLGGSDNNNISKIAMQAMQPLSGLQVKLVIGSTNRHAAELKQICKTNPNRFTFAESVKNMAELYHQADIAISAPGGTMWELALNGIPTILIAINDNHIAIANKLVEEGVALYAGFYQDVTAQQIHDSVIKLKEDSSLRTSLSQSAMKFVDGKGVERIYRIINNEIH